MTETPPKHTCTLVRSTAGAPTLQAVQTGAAPWRLLAEVALPQDYVVVKLDVDHPGVELALLHQLLDAEENHASPSMGPQKSR